MSTKFSAPNQTNVDIWKERLAKSLVPTMGRAQIAKRGHRNYVGGKWELLGKLQFNFLYTQGLKPEHTLYDIACGSLRAGVLLIPFLDQGNYCGIDREADLITAGVNHELTKHVYLEKKPQFVISSAFEFSKFTKRPDFAIAQSLFTHLSPQDICLCLRNLLSMAKDTTKFYATFDEEGVTPKSQARINLPNPPWSHSNLTFYYHFKDMKEFAKNSGWKIEYIGDWGHPMNQRMILFYL